MHGRRIRNLSAPARQPLSRSARKMASSATPFAPHLKLRHHPRPETLDTARIIKEEPNSAQSRVQATSGPDWSQPRLRVSNETMEHEQSTYPTQKSSAHNLFADRSALPVDLPRLRPSRSVSIHIHTAASHLESAKRCGYLWTYKNNSFSINHLDFDTRGGGYTRYSMIRATTS